MSEVLAEVELPATEAPATKVIVEQRIGEGNSTGVVAYRLVIGGRRARLEAVPMDGTSHGNNETNNEGETTTTRRAVSTRRAASDDGAVVVMSQSPQTAEAVRRGELGALAALQAGLIKVSGDVRVLVAAAPALAAVDAALAAALADTPEGPAGDAGDGGEGTNPDAQM